LPAMARRVAPTAPLKGAVASGLFGLRGGCGMPDTRGLILSLPKDGTEFYERPSWFDRLTMRGG